MPLDARKLDQRIRKLRKTLTGFPKDPTADEVHDLRTRTRRVESILEALEVDSSKSERKLLSGLESVRKRAGKVRNMDVLTSYVVALDVKNDRNCMVRLVHYLGVQRYRHARKLRSTVRREAPDLRQRLKRVRRKLDSTVKRFEKIKFKLENDGRVEENPLHAVSVALRLTKELAAEPRLGPNNLHAYRLEAKRLRYVLEMADADQGAGKPFIEELTRVQGAIGEWHDWVELASIAHEVLHQDRGCIATKKIGKIAAKKFKESLRVTEQMRRRYLLPTYGETGRGNPVGRKRVKVAGPILVATSEIAA